jgi:hypothetical protein
MKCRYDSLMHGSLFTISASLEQMSLLSTYMLATCDFSQEWTYENENDADEDDADSSFDYTP